MAIPAKGSYADVVLVMMCVSHACASHAGAYQGATQRLTNELQWDSILPCHGNYISSGGKQILTKHLGLKQ